MKQESVDVQFDSLEERNNAIVKEYYRLREKRIPQHDSLKALVELGIFRTETGSLLTVSSIRCIVTNKMYLKKDRGVLR